MSDKTKKRQIVAKPTIKCPTCGAPAELKLRPFCSQRCANVDLGHWIQGKYSIPAVDAADDTIVDALLMGQNTALEEDNRN